ncbi:MAG: class I SAM-dependent methyltransferase [Rhodospirillales bacterium]
MEKRSSTDVIEELLDLRNAVVVDVGCGDGWLTRWLTAKGAHATGIEVSPRQLAKARAVKAVADETYLTGLAEDLPVRSRWADVVVFYNSLHHVDAVGLPKALKEAARVLKHGGILYVSEPLPEGAYFQLMKPAHDETQARRRTQQVLKTAPEYGLLLERQLTHLDAVVFADFQAFHDRITSINPETRARFDELEASFRARFESLGEKVDNGWRFDQPMRVALLRRS